MTIIRHKRFTSVISRPGEKLETVVRVSPLENLSKVAIELVATVQGGGYVSMGPSEIKELISILQENVDQVEKFAIENEKPPSGTVMIIDKDDDIWVPHNNNPSRWMLRRYFKEHGEAAPIKYHYLKSECAPLRHLTEA